MADTSTGSGMWRILNTTSYFNVHSRKGMFIPKTVLLGLSLCLLIYYLSWQTLHYTSYLSPIQKSTPVEVTTTTPTTISPYDPSKLALLVETRPLPHLPALFAHMSSIIPPEWTFLFLGSNISIPFLRTSPTIARLESTGRMRLDFIPSNYSLTSRETISQMFTDLHLYETILSPAEHLLVFQPDSIFCANAPTTLNDFLDWDWIGAPWSVDATHGGNGGLGLRKVSKILEVLKKEKRQDGDGQLEDLWLSERINHLKGARMPNATISKTFSVESVWDDRPLGYHVGWLGVHHPQIWDDQNQVDHIMSYCPEVKMILGMKLDNDKPKAVQTIKVDNKKKPGR